jgi:uncharacterized protein YcnI
MPSFCTLVQLRGVCAAAAGVLFSSSAFGHITLETSQATADSYYKLVLKVPHGCAGSPTVRLRVRIPDGVTGVKLQPKPGWKHAAIKGKLPVPFDDGHGNKITEGVREASWSGGRLLDDEYDEFAMQVKLPDKPGAVLYFPVVQECVKGVTRWIEIPEAGKKREELKEPAPSLRLMPKS